uniref:Saposin B-type domain-containing protein n=1 Tax=Rhabditophanes sp. KR3021 TaxID=114890 RepID=A0AC35TJW0_9BILA
MIEQRSASEIVKRKERIDNLLQNPTPLMQIVTEGEDAAQPDPDCPAPSPTIFPDSKPTSLGGNFAEFIIPEHFKLPYFELLKEAIQNEEKICNGPKFTGFDSVTDEQLRGLLALFAVNHADHLCPICSSVVSHLHKNLLDPNILNFDSEHEYKIAKMIYQYIPDVESICSVLLPGCHEDYEMKVKNGTRASKCLECTVCMTGSTVLEHTIFLNQPLIDNVHHFLNLTIFKELCAEMCHLPPNSIFPNGIPYQKCRGALSNFYTFVMSAARNILIPNNICALELGMCEVGATPNVLSCLTDICLDKVPHALEFICSIIPADPTEAAYFIGLKRRPDHEATSQQNSHTEL